jgi:hypothetical protein
MEINREELYKLYMDWVHEVSEECDWKTHFGPEEIVGAICTILEKNPMLVKTTFVSDDINGQWLSPVRTEREWQEGKLVELFGHYPNASPRWQYMNNLIIDSIEYRKLMSEDEEEG